MNPLDESLMDEALSLAEKGNYCTAPNPRVGCVIWSEGNIVGRGWHRGPGQAHAEVVALRDAGERARGATLCVNLEPCSHYGRTPPCVDAVIAAGVKRVIFPFDDSNPLVSGNGRRKLLEAGIEVTTGVRLERATALNVGFLKRMQTGLPHVRCKIALSLDGKIALRDGTSHWITCGRTREVVHDLRGRSDAIVVGIGTVLRDNPGLDARPVDVPEGGLVQPLKVVLDSKGQLPPGAKMLTTPGRTLVFTLKNACQQGGPEIEVVEFEPDPSGVYQISLRQVLLELGRRGVNEVLLEGGARVVTEAARCGVVDEWILHYGPKLLGMGLSPYNAVHERMADVLSFEVASVERLGEGFAVRLSRGLAGLRANEQTSLA
jgi:diaminohydroxyphosphoribosylaminopyrimidine deaminase / 5-amino-6-(5-phosphoribosylamino)uracil reductase